MARISLAQIGPQPQMRLKRQADRRRV